MFQWRISQSMQLKPSCYSCPAFSTDRTVLVDCWASQKETTKWQDSEQPVTRAGHDTDQMESTYKFAIGSNTCVISGICNQCKLPTSGPICIICRSGPICIISRSSPICSSCTWPTPLRNVKTYFILKDSTSALMQKLKFIHKLDTHSWKFSQQLQAIKKKSASKSTSFLTAKRPHPQFSSNHSLINVWFEQ